MEDYRYRLALIWLHPALTDLQLVVNLTKTEAWKNKVRQRPATNILYLVSVSVPGLAFLHEQQTF